MATFINLVTEIVENLTSLFVIISGQRHGILQGTQEAVWAEAQGAQIGPRGFNHMADLQGTLRDITAREAAMNNTLNQLNGVAPNLGNRVKDVLSPLFQQTQFYRQTLAESEKLGLELARTNGTRLAGVTFGQGGGGPEIGRTTQSLISTQMNQRTQELTTRGISEPNRLVPAAQAARTQVIGAIRQLPMTTRDAADKVVAIVSAIRALATQAARQALTAGNLVLSQALNSVGRALAAVAARFGGRLSTPLIILNLRQIKRDLGIIDVDDFSDGA